MDDLSPAAAKLLEAALALPIEARRRLRDALFASLDPSAPEDGFADLPLPARQALRARLLSRAGSLSAAPTLSAAQLCEDWGRVAGEASDGPLPLAIHPEVSRDIGRRHLELAARDEQAAEDFVDATLAALAGMRRELPLSRAFEARVRSAPLPEGPERVWFEEGAEGIRILGLFAADAGGA